VGLRNVLIDGISGAGKTTVAEELERRGYHVVHGDRVLAYVGDPETGQVLSGPPADTTDPLAWSYAHWVWPVDKVRNLIADHQHPITFFCGGSQNSRHFVHLFDAVFVLDIDTDTLKRRLDRRPEDEFGGKPADQAFLLQLYPTRATTLAAGTRIDATAPTSRIADEILRRVGETASGPA
jgi:hypothetical protein